MCSKGYKVNLKKLLSLNLEDDEFVTRSIRVPLELLTYEISFYINGESLCLTDIRPILQQTPPNQPNQKGIRPRGVETEMPTERHQRLEVADKAPTALLKTTQVDVATQAAVRELRSTESMTKVSVKYHRQQQTNRAFFQNSHCQTDCCSFSAGVQTDWSSATHTTQTELLTNSIGVQTELFHYDKTTQTYDEQEASATLDERYEPVLFMATRIGGIVLKHHALLFQNLKLLQELGGMVTPRPPEIQPIFSKIARKLRKEKCAREYMQSRAKTHMSERRKRLWVKKLSKSVQTEQRLSGIHLSTLETYTQTECSCKSQEASSQTECNCESQEESSQS